MQTRVSFACQLTSWHRDVAGLRIANSVVDELLTAIDDGNRSILLTGHPGSGKTCAMLDLQESLEQRSHAQADVTPLFIQSREFADLTTAQERQAQGLPEQWVQQAARLAEDSHVIVVIDSLDVLSIAREHKVLTYFLAQIDQLLLVPNITVVTACRDFDKNYDQRMASRNWDCELQCLPLDWETTIVPLLNTLGINSKPIDNATQELIRNPRELALFVDLATREGSFNVVTSQALAQHYLDTIVQADPSLGNEAMQAIESLADEMLRTRSISIPHQQFGATPDIQRRLHSLNVLQNTHDGKLTFGHQTLLDVLVISSALRRGVSLNGFIQDLPPVPFVRPSIRSFVAQLAMGRRSEFRKQIRTVLTGNSAFHIRRLVAESFAQQKPQEDDWPLIRDLRERHRDVFQVIYTRASMVEWHFFWMSYLVPLLNESKDAADLTAHVHHVTQWNAEDPMGVSEFWLNALDIDFLEEVAIANRLGFSISEFKTEDLHLIVPILERLLSMSKPEHSSLGRTVARCISSGVADDSHLWSYIAGEVCKDDALQPHFGNKLRCKPHEFGEKDQSFLKQRMVHSTTLLDLALAEIEHWSQIKSAQYVEPEVGYRRGFLSNTSYNDTHTQVDHRLIDSERVLMSAVEAAIIDQAKNNSDWWQAHCEGLAFNREGSLCYFALLALINNHVANIDLIGRLLCDRNLLEFKLSYEIGTLIHTAFICLDTQRQDAAEATILNVWGEANADEEPRPWILQRRAEYISTIPRHLRSPEAHAILDIYEKRHDTLVRRPSLGMRGGYIVAPFSFEVFLAASDNGIIELLAHYHGYNRDHEDYLVGGEREVGVQLHEASSRHPSRFLKMLVTDWTKIPLGFRDDILDGVTTYLAHRHGNLRANESWVPIKEVDGSILANDILDELVRHSYHWRINHSAAKALEACAHAIENNESAARFVFLTIAYISINEESTFDEGSVDLINSGINMKTGNIAEALIILTTNLHEHDIALPDLLHPTLRRLTDSESPSVLALVLRRLPYFQSLNPELGWELFHRTMQDGKGLWSSAERCLYYAYRDRFENVAPLLERIRLEGNTEDMETWGRISCLAALTGHIDFAHFLGELHALNKTKAWKGAASVWANIGNIKEHRKQCLEGIETGLKTDAPHASAVANRLKKIFHENGAPLLLPAELIQLWLNVVEKNCEGKHNELFGFAEWLNTISQRDPELALTAAEIYLDYVSRTEPYFYDHKNELVQLVTRLFAEAEEREESDQGAMLRRVVSVQDSLLSLGVSSINDWLKAAERQ